MEIVVNFLEKLKGVRLWWHYLKVKEARRVQCPVTRVLCQERLIFRTKREIVVLVPSSSQEIGIHYLSIVMAIYECTVFD